MRYRRNKVATVIGGIVIGIITLGALFCLGAVIYGSCTNQSFPCFVRWHYYLLKNLKPLENEKLPF